MDRVLINPAIVSDIADAIREKGGTTEQIIVNQLGDAVRALPSGGGIADSTKELVNIVSGVTPTDELSLNNGIAKGAVDAPTEQSWEGERTTAGGGTIKDGIAYLEKVKGRSIKVNQIAPTADGFVVSSGAVIEDGIFILPNGGSAPNVHSRNGMNIYQGHTYLFVMSAKKDEGATYNGMSIRINDGSYPIASLTIATTSWGVASARAVVANAVTKTNVYIMGRLIEGGNYYIKDIMAFDLTAMGKEDITTADQLAQYLGYADAASMPFIPYTPESIVVHSKHSEVVSKGRNIWDEEWENGTIAQSNGKKSQGSAIVSKNALPNNRGTFYVSCPSLFILFGYKNNGEYVGYNFYNNAVVTQESLLVLTDSSGTITQRNKIADADYFLFRTSGYNGTIYNHDIYIEGGSTSHGYTPFMSPDTLPLPSLELRGVGTAQDEYTPSTGEVVRKMGVVDLGTLSWMYTGDETRNFRTSSLRGIIVEPADSNEVPNIICKKFDTTNYLSLANQNTICVIWGSSAAHGQVWVSSNQYSDAASFMAAMQGVLLYYELAEPTTEQLTPQKAYYKAQSNGKEVAVAETLSAPFVAEIGYEEGTNAQVLNLL